MEEHKCTLHSLADAQHQCTNCGRWFCSDCLFSYLDKHYCKTKTCGAVYLSVVKGNAKKETPLLKQRGSLIRKSGIGLLIFSLLNLIFSSNKPAKDLSLITPDYSAEMLNTLPEYKALINSFTGMFDVINMIAELDVYLSAIGIMVAAVMIGRVKGARLLFVGYLILGMCFTIWASYATYQQVGILRQNTAAISQYLPAIPFLGPLFTAILAGVGMMLLTMLWMIIKFLRYRDE